MKGRSIVKMPQKSGDLEQFATGQEQSRQQAKADWERIITDIKGILIELCGRINKRTIVNDEEDLLLTMGTKSRNKALVHEKQEELLAMKRQ